MPEILIPIRPNEDGSGNFTHFPAATSTARALHLIIQTCGDHFRIQGIGNGLDELEDWEAEIPMTQAQLYGEILAIRETWQEATVTIHNGRKPLMTEWNVSAVPEFQRKILGPLAVAGAKLFNGIFFPASISGNKHERLNALGTVLRDMPSQWLRITSPQFFAPWNLIYSHDPGFEGEEACKVGFWGYQHLIEHATRARNEVRAFSDAKPFQLAAHFDTAIDATLNVRCNQAIYDLLAHYDIEPTYRNTKKELFEALAEVSKEHVMYFCCHAQAGKDSRLELTDRKPITPADIKQWMDKRFFEKNPIVFLNMCEGSQVNTMFYQGFVEVFFDRGASAVVGPQTEVPAVFAGQFASRFFEDLFAGNKRRIGHILFDLRREFFDKFCNPLGLLYSLYRGADLYLPAGLPLKTENHGGK